MITLPIMTTSRYLMMMLFMLSLKKIDFSLKSLQTRFSYLRLRYEEHMALNIKRTRVRVPNMTREE
jgi:hypothetical protein